MADWHQGECHFALRIEVEQAVHRVVDESANYLRGQSQRSANCQQVGEQRAIVPSEMAVGAVLILPCVAPVGGGADDGQRTVSDIEIIGSGVDEDTAIVSGAQFAEAEFSGGEVIDASFESREITADQIEFDLVERSGAGGGTEIDFAARIFSVPRDSRREV